jgi:hypothetical protein
MSVVASSGSMWTLAAEPDIDQKFDYNCRGFIQCVGPA